MDTFLLFISFILMLLGLVGVIAPIIPGAITSWLGLFLLYRVSYIKNDFQFLIITFLVALGVFLLDYILPALGAKKYGGSRYGIIGSMIGLLFGIFLFPPWGMVIGPFVGAYLGELLNKFNDIKGALRAAFGTFIGFVMGTVLKVILAIVYFVLYAQILWKHKHLL